jgi:hypothetical protein
MRIIAKLGVQIWKKIWPGKRLATEDTESTEEEKFVLAATCPGTVRSMVGDSGAGY